MMKPDGGPAFPNYATGHVEESQGSGHNNLRFELHGGMSLRDYLAAQSARQAAEVVCDMLQSDGHGDPYLEAERHARAAYIVADAMLKAR